MELSAGFLVDGEPLRDGIEIRKKLFGTKSIPQFIRCFAFQLLRFFSPLLCLLRIIQFCLINGIQPLSLSLN